jgi:acetyl esterase/lipase
MVAEAPLLTTSTSSTLNSQRIVSRTPPFYHRIAYFISLWAFITIFRLNLSAKRLLGIQKNGMLKAEVKMYDVRPDLGNRIFRPPSSADVKLPLYLDVHGGGWAVADPETDDEFCSFLAQKFNIIVVSINYHKSPRYKFPYAVLDVAAIARAVIDDRSLNIDISKVVLGGFSAGGNLAFAAAQTESLRGQLSALIGFYPALDLTEDLVQKLSHRPTNSPHDILASSVHLLDWAYVPAGIDRRDPPPFTSMG